MPGLHGLGSWVRSTVLKRRRATAGNFWQMRFDCPECDQGIEVEARYIGRDANCPHCDEGITVPMVSGAPPRAAMKVEEEDEVEEGRKNLGKLASDTVANALKLLRLSELRKPRDRATRQSRK